jgi:hypothetical protein
LGLQAFITTHRGAISFLLKKRIELKKYVAKQVSWAENKNIPHLAMLQGQY